MIFYAFTAIVFSLTVNINQQQYTGSDYDSILSSYGSDISTIKSLKVIQGNFYLSSISKRYTQLSVLEIPSTSFSGSIGNEHFKDMISLQTVILNGATSIGSNSFQNCIQLETVEFSSCISIGNYAFSGCLLLKSATFPKLTTIGAYGFEKVGLTEIELNSAYIFNTKLDILRGLDGSQFSGCSKLSKITMKSAPLIQRYMFENCNSLVYVDMPSCLNIGDRAFVGCNSLDNVFFPRLLSIGEFSFYSLIGLTTVNLPTVNNIGRRCFSKCSNLRSASFDFCVTVDEESFADCLNLETINFPRLTTIGNSAFSNTGLSSVKLNSAVELDTEFELWIGDVGRQFSGCSRLKSVTMNNLQTVKSYTFEDCEFLEEVNLPRCTEIELNGFIGCTNIKKLSLGYSLVNFRSIPQPSILTHLYFPYALVVLDGTFSSLNDLVSCRLPMVTKIGSSLFRDHSKLTEVLLPRVREIEGDFAFFNCENLQLISLQSLTTVNKASENLFSRCNNLKYIYFPKSPPKTFNSNSFVGLPLSIVIPNDSIKTYDNDLSVDGDVANDGKWCGVVLKEYDFIECAVNILWSGFGFNLHDAVLVSGMSENDVYHLQVKSGTISQDELNSFKSNFVNLFELVIDESVVIENQLIPENFMLNHKEIMAVTINSNVKIIENSAFEGCSKLRSFKCQTATELKSRCFYGPTSIESLSFELVEKLDGSDFFSNNAVLTAIYLPKLTSFSVTGYVSQKSTQLTTVLLPKKPPTSTSGTFLIDVQPKLIGLSNDEAKIYDAADGVDNDMKYYSLNVSYTLITCLIDGQMIGGINLKGIVRDGNKIVQVIEGDVFESDFQLPNSVVSLTIPESSIVEKIPKNAMSHNSNLKRISIYSKNSLVIEDEAFSGCSNLETVIINGATVLNGLAFKDCIHLKTVVLDNVNEIVGNFNFDGCNELRSISFLSLTKVPSESTMIFRGCLTLSTIKLPSKPPLVFNKGAFSGIQSHVTLSLPNQNDYKTYDNDKSIEGDIENDGYWCGILLPTNELSIQLNDHKVPIYGKDVADCITKSGIVESEIKSLEIINGIVGVQSLLDSIKNLPFLEKLIVSKSVFFNGNFEDAAFSGLNLVSIKLPVIQTIPANFFKNCIKLKNVEIDDATKICSSAFSGCTSLEAINLNAEIFEGDGQFEGCTSLTVVGIQNLKTVDSKSTKIFDQCPLRSIYLPSTPPKTFNKAIFEGKKVIINGLTTEELKIYDYNIDVEGDVVNDRKWCGIDLIQIYILVSLNGKGAVYMDTLINEETAQTVEIKGGMFKKSHFNELKKFTSLTNLIISNEAVLESSNIESGQFRGMKNLVSVSIMQDVSLMSDCFNDCSSLKSVEFKSVNILNERTFKSCSSLSNLKIPNCKELKGDEIFSGCSSLQEIDLSYLESVESTSSRLFDGCSQLKTVYLSSKEPIEFNKETFKYLSNIKLVLPTYDDYIAYDDQSHVENDVKEDEKWCGIDLSSENLPPLLNYEINGVEFKSRKIQSIDQIKSLHLIGGVFDPNLIKQVINESKSTIEKFEVNSGTLSEILPGTFYLCNSLREIIIHDEVKIGLNSLQNIPSLVILSIDFQQNLRSDEFKGNSNLEEISLPLLRTVPENLFTNLLKLKKVNLNSTSTIQSGCFKNCVSIEKVDLSSVSLVAGDSHFDGCSSLKVVDLSGLKNVNKSASLIFNRCNNLNQIKLGNEPPNLFNESVFVNAGVVPNISILDSNQWNNYISQSVVNSTNNHYFWYGFDTGIKIVQKSCPKNQKTTVIVLAVFTAIFGVTSIGLLIALIVSCCSYGGVCGEFP